MIKLTISAITVVIIFSACNNRHNVEKTAERYEIKTIKTDNGWGYEISKGKRPFIKQLIIPSVSGSCPFASERDATVAGSAVLAKVRNQQSPSLTIKEMDSMEIKLPINSTSLQ